LASNAPRCRQPEPEAEGGVEDQSWQGGSFFFKCGAAGAGVRARGLLGAGSAAEHEPAGGGRRGRARA
jgi:hypothetical protein